MRKRADASQRGSENFNKCIIRLREGKIEEDQIRSKLRTGENAELPIESSELKVSREELNGGGSKRT